MAITYGYFESVDDLMLTNSAADEITATIVCEGSGSTDTVDIYLAKYGGVQFMAGSATVQLSVETAISIPVNGLDALYSDMANDTSAQWYIIPYYNGNPIGPSTIFTVSVDTSAVYPTIVSPYFKWNGGYSDQTTYAISDYGTFYVGASSVTPGRGATFKNMEAAFADGTIFVSSSLEITDQMYSFPTISAPVTLQAWDSRSAASTVSTLSGFTVYSWDQPDAEFSWARGTYAGGVWTPSDTGEDARIQVDATFSANTADYSVIGTVDMTASIGGVTQTQTLTFSDGDGAQHTQYAYFTGIGAINSVDIAIDYYDNIVNLVIADALSIPPLNTPLQITADGTGMGLFATPSNGFLDVGIKTIFRDAVQLSVPLGLQYGGLGVAANSNNGKAQARQNLGINYPNLGVNSVATGGTGGTTAAEARANLGINYATLGAVKITEGGTGATTRGNALANLNGVANAPSRSGITYSSLDATGLVSAPATIYSVANAAPANSVITWTHSTNHTMYLTNAPENLGVVTVTKGIGTNYMSAIFYGQSGRAYFWKYSGSNSNFNNYWQRLSVASAITISDVTAAQTLTTTATRVNLDNSTAVNASDDSLSIISYGIRCNYPGYVEISAQLYAGSVTAGDRLNLNIYAGPSGSLSSIRVARYDSPATHVTGNIVPFIYQCAANDLIYLYAHNGTAARGSIATGNQTYLTVKYV